MANPIGAPTSGIDTQQKKYVFDSGYSYFLSKKVELILIYFAVILYLHLYYVVNASCYEGENLGRLLKSIQR